MPPIGDAVQERPTLEQEMAKFQGYSTTDGEPSTGAQTAEETARLAADAKQGAQAGAAAAAGEERRRLADVLAEGAEGEDTAGGEGDDSAAGDGADSEGGEGADELGSETDGSANAEPPKKNKQSLQDRMNDVVRLRRAAEHRARLAEQKNADLERRLGALERGERDPLTPRGDTSTSEAATEAAPDPSKFEYGELDPKYITALARHETKQELRAARAADDKTRQDEAARQSASEHVTKVASFAEDGAAKYDDFNDVVMESAKAGEWDLTAVVGELMLGSVYGHDIAYYLATHPTEASRIAAQSPAAQAAAFGRMEAKLEAAAASRAGDPPVKPSRAPPPVKTPRGPSGKYAVSAATENFSDFEKLANAGR